MADVIHSREAEEKELSDEIIMVVKNNWERIAKEYGLSRGQIENMRPAFLCKESNICFDIGLKRCYYNSK